MDALALGAEEGRDKPRKAAVRSKYPLDQQISEWETTCNAGTGEWNIAHTEGTGELEHLRS